VMDDPTSLLDGLKTGDVLLYRTTDLGATFNACVQGDKWSHVGLVVEATPELESLYASDYAGCGASTPKRAKLAVFEAVVRRGVSLFPLEARLARTVNSLRLVAVRKLSRGTFSSIDHQALHSFIKEVLGRPLETVSCAELRAIWLSMGGGGFKSAHEDHSEFFCSELVAEALQQAGVLPDDGLNSNDFLPKAFEPHDDSGTFGPRVTLDGYCRKGFSYGPLQMLVSPQSTLVAALRDRKRALKEEQEQARQQAKQR